MESIKIDKFNVIIISSNKDKSCFMEEVVNNTKKEFIRTIKFVLFSISAGIIQVLSFTIMEEGLHLTHWLSYLVLH